MSGALPAAKRILVIMGTRPEAVKLAPVVRALTAQAWADVKVCATAQHRTLLDQVLEFFGLRPQIDLDIMRPDQSLTELTARLLSAIGGVLDAERPDAVLVQGDTTTAMAGALAAFYRRIPIGHVEAGLRTGRMDDPFPEEANRIIAGVLATWHFAPTAAARTNLLQAGVPADDVIVTGNTVIDALYWAVGKRPQLGIDIPADRRIVLVTAHRRENFGEPMRRIFTAIGRLAAAHPDVTFLFPVHPNPNVRAHAAALEAKPNVILTEPLPYGAFVAAIQRAHFILTDSGGLQEEAPALGKPILVLRQETERPEAVAAGVAKLIGTDEQRIFEEASALITNLDAWRALVRNISPYGDGEAAGRIAEFLRDRLAATASGPLR